MKKTLLSLAGLFLLSTSLVSAHCQVPCGIYNDSARVTAMLEDAQTVVKAVTLINELAGKTDAQSVNQVTRWVSNKESHADQIIQTMANYFLTQRIKNSQSDYTERLVKHHQVIVAAMKAKQTVSAENAQNLVSAIEKLAPYYPKK